MDMITAAMQSFYEQYAKRDERNRRDMLELFNQTGRVESDEKDTDIVFGRNANETV